MTGIQNCLALYNVSFNSDSELGLEHRTDFQLPSKSGQWSTARVQARDQGKNQPFNLVLGRSASDLVFVISSEKCEGTIQHED